MCHTYNHQDFIEESLHSVLKQRTKYRFKILVVDDCSTDATKSKILRIIQEHPGSISLISYDENRMQTGVHFDYSLVQRYAPRYVAYCEGDDFWISEDKLDQQISALDRNEKIAFSYHPFDLVGDQKNKRPPVVGLHRRLASISPLASLYRFFSSSSQLCTVCIRYSAIPFNLLTEANLSPRDQILFLGALENGSRLFQKNLKSAYRLHSSNYWSTQDVIDRTHQELTVFSLAFRRLSGRARLLASIQISLRFLMFPKLTTSYYFQPSVLKRSKS